MSLRGSGFLNGIGWMLTLWGIGFTLDLVARADNVTSPQWRYLMSVPGGEWSWVAVFGSGTVLLIAGMLSQAYKVRAFGCAVMAVGAGLIGAFYMAAPIIDPGLTTLGYWPWLLTMGVMIVGAAVNLKPASWF